MGRGWGGGGHLESQGDISGELTERVILIFYSTGLRMRFRRFRGLAQCGGLSVAHPSCSESKKNASGSRYGQPPPSDYAHRKNGFFLFLRISVGSFEEERRSENASWLYVFKFIPFHLLITYIPFKVAGPGCAAFFLSPATMKPWGAHYLHARPAPGSAEGREAVFPECPLCATSYMGIASSHHGNKHIRLMPLPPFCRRRTCSQTESATALGFEPSSARTQPG